MTPKHTLIKRNSEKQKFVFQIITSHFAIDVHMNHENAHKIHMNI